MTEAQLKAIENLLAYQFRRFMHDAGMTQTDYRSDAQIALGEALKWRVASARRGKSHREPRYASANVVSIRRGVK